MSIIIAIILIVGGLATIFYIRPKIQAHVTEIKYLQTKNISELRDMFTQMDSTGVGDQYREFVELKGKIVANNLIETPFSNRKVAYCKSKLAQVNLKTRINKHENTISEEKSSQDIYMKDDSSEENVVLEINGVGCDLDIPKTFDRFEPKNNLSNYRYFNSFSVNRFGAETLGFKMTEETIEENQNLYVIGEAFRVGDTIHIGKPEDKKKPFIVTTKSEEDLINKSNQNAMFSLVGGIVAIIVGIIFLYL